MGTAALRMIHSRVSWMFLPVERSITVSAPQRVAHTIFSTSSSTELVTAELPILALILVRKFRPMIIGSDSGWLILAGMMARPRATSDAHEFGRHESGQRGAEALPVRKPRFRLFGLTRAPEIFPVRDIGHLLGDDAGPRPFELGHKAGSPPSLDPGRAKLAAGRRTSMAAASSV